MRLSGAEEHIPGYSFLGRSLVEGRGLKGWKRQERTFGHSYPFLVCWFLFGAGTPAIVGSCGQKSGAAKECCCSCEGGSRRQLLEGGGGLMTGAEIAKTGWGQGNAAAQDGIPDLNSFSSCWGWDSPLQLGGRTGAWMAVECAG